MTVPLSPGSPRRDHARRFGVELRRAMDRRKVSQKSLAPAAGVSVSMVANWKAGRNLPTLATAIRIADALGTPRLADIVRKARTGSCATCGRGFLNEGGKPKRYCGDPCRDQAARGRAPAREARRRATAMLADELFRPGGVRKQVVGKAVTMLQGDSDVAVERRLTEHVDAVASMCGECEPQGYCRTEGCPLRAVSPLPLAIGHRDAEAPVPPPGRWGQPGARERWSEHMRRRWADPVASVAQRRGIEAAQRWRDEHPEEFRAAVSRGRRAG